MVDPIFETAGGPAFGAVPRMAAEPMPGPPDIAVVSRAVMALAFVPSIVSRDAVPAVSSGAGGRREPPIHVCGGLRLDTSGCDRAADAGIVEAGMGGPEPRRLPRDARIDPGSSPGGMAGRAVGADAVPGSPARDTLPDPTRGTRNGRLPRSSAPAAEPTPAGGLTRLFVGPGRRLRAVPEVPLHPSPTVGSSSAHASFESLSGAVAFVVEMKRAGVAVGRVELLDARLAGAVARRGALQLGARPTLFFEFRGEPEVVDDAGDAVEEMLEAEGGEALSWASNPVAAAWLWHVRRNALAWACAEQPGILVRATEIGVPLPRLGGIIEGMRAEAEAAGITAYILGPVGDGSVRCVFAHAPGEEAVVEALSGHVALRAVAAAGVATRGSATGPATYAPGRANTAGRRSASCPC